MFAVSKLCRRHNHGCMNDESNLRRARASRCLCKAHQHHHKCTYYTPTSTMNDLTGDIIGKSSRLSWWFPPMTTFSTEFHYSLLHNVCSHLVWVARIGEASSAAMHLVLLGASYGKGCILAVVHRVARSTTSCAASLLSQQLVSSNVQCSNYAWDVTRGLLWWFAVSAGWDSSLKYWRLAPQVHARSSLLRNEARITTL